MSSLASILAAKKTSIPTISNTNSVNTKDVEILLDSYDISKETEETEKDSTEYISKESYLKQKDGKEYWMYNEFPSKNRILYKQLWKWFIKNPYCEIRNIDRIDLIVRIAGGIILNTFPSCSVAEIASTLIKKYPPTEYNHLWKLATLVGDISLYVPQDLVQEILKEIGIENE